MRTGAKARLGAGAWGKTKTEPKVEPVVEPEEKVEKKTEKKRKTTSE